jgi:hypothetical protein
MIDDEITEHNCINKKNIPINLGISKEMRILNLQNVLIKYIEVHYEYLLYAKS